MLIKRFFMNRHQYKYLTIEVVDEPHYTASSYNKGCNYSTKYFAGDDEQYQTRTHGVKILLDGKEINNCLIGAYGGPTGINQNSSLIQNDQIIICCCDSIFCLTLPELRLDWIRKCDPSSCLQIFKYQDDFIIHGESVITKLNKVGQIIWQFSGEDIFVSIDNEQEFNFEDDGILLIDFRGTKYKIDYDGKLVWDTCKQ